MNIYDTDLLDTPDPKKPGKDKEKPDSYGVASRGPGKAPQIRNTDKINRHVASLLIKYGMDYKAVVAKMLEEGAPEAHIDMLARTLEQRPSVARFLKEALAAAGLGPDAEKEFMATLSFVARDTKHKHWPSAIKQVGDYYGWSKKSEDADKPVTLVLKGFEKEVAELFDGKLPDSNAMPKRRPAIIEKEVEDTDEDIDVIQ